MSQYEVLNKDKHSQLRIKTGFGAELGDAAMYVATYALEFRDIQSCYPILFTKDPESGGFFAAALLGFEAGQNLFLKNGVWDASYVPAMVRRQPFLIATGSGGDNDNPVVSVDRTNPRVTEDDGELLFDDNGELTEYLQHQIRVLDKLHHGLQHNSGFIEALLKHDLLEQITVDITFADGESKSLQGFYSIAEERLFKLEGSILETLSQAGYLQPIFMAVASLSQMRDVIERRNQPAA